MQNIETQVDTVEPPLRDHPDERLLLTREPHSDLNLGINGKVSTPKCKRVDFFGKSTEILFRLYTKCPLKTRFYGSGFLKSSK